MMWMGECMIGLGHLVQPREVMDIIEAVSPVQVRQLAAEIFQPGRITLAGVGPELDQAVMDEVAEAFNLLA
jgi:predicted Zn-dependent peptidase